MLRLICFLLFAPTCSFPYLDGLQLDQKDRLAIYGKYRGMVPTRDWCCTDGFPADREATRLYLLDMVLHGKSADDVWYAYGRLVGRMPMWQTWMNLDGTFSVGWYDEWFERNRDK